MSKNTLKGFKLRLHLKLKHLLCLLLGPLSRSQSSVELMIDPAELQLRLGLDSFDVVIGWPAGGGGGFAHHAHLGTSH
jgi:hypothetical protein